MRQLLKLAASLALLLSLSVGAHDAPPDVTIDGLLRIPDTDMDLIYAMPDTDLSEHNRLYLAPVSVSFVKGYKRRMNSQYAYSITDADMEEMKTALATTLVEEFTQVLQNDAGYVIVDGAADDVLAVRVAILDLDVVAPEAGARPNTRSAIPSAGQLTLYMELIDSVSGDILVKALDHQYDRSRVQINLRNRDRNEKAARAIIRDWAEQLRAGLDEAHTRTKP